ncbi:MAG: hypothetical protein ABIZ04_04585 [Opitutus sp.]
MSSWTLKVGSVTRSIAGWGIDWDSLQCRFNSWDADEVSFAMTKASVLEDPVFAYGDDVTLYKDATIWFVGKIWKPSVAANSRSEVQKYLCKNVWQQLENLQYEQQRNTKVAADNFASFQQIYSTRAVLGSRLNTSAAGLTKIDTKDQMVDLLDWAIAEGLSLQYNVNFSGLTPPYEEAKDMTVAAAMRRMGAWTPDCATRFDYSTTPPTLYISRRPTATTRTIDLLAVSVGGLVEFAPMAADYDLVPSGVDVTFVGGVTNPADGVRYALYNRITSTYLPSIDRSRLLRGTLFLAGSGTIDEEATPTALAQAYADALSELFWNTTLTFAHVECPGTYRPGNLVNLTNGQTAWATAKAIIQAVTETPAKGLTVVECGRPPMLSTGTLAELQRRISNVQNTAGTVTVIATGGTSGEPTEVFTGFRTVTIPFSGWDNVHEVVQGSATIEVQILTRVSCKIRITAFSALTTPTLNPNTNFFALLAYDATGTSLGLFLPMNTWSSPIPTGTHLIQCNYEFVFVRTGSYNNAVTATPTTLVMQLNANP